MSWDTLPPPTTLQQPPQTTLPLAKTIGATTLKVSDCRAFTSWTVWARAARNSRWVGTLAQLGAGQREMHARLADVSDSTIARMESEVAGLVSCGCDLYRVPPPPPPTIRPKQGHQPCPPLMSIVRVQAAARKLAEEEWRRVAAGVGEARADHAALASQFKAVAPALAAHGESLQALAADLASLEVLMPTPHHTTEEMMQPCRIRLHAVSFVAHRPLAMSARTLRSRVFVGCCLGFLKLSDDRPSCQAASRREQAAQQSATAELGPRVAAAEAGLEAANGQLAALCPQVWAGLKEAMGEVNRIGTVVGDMEYTLKQDADSAYALHADVHAHGERLAELAATVAMPEQRLGTAERQLEKLSGRLEEVSHGLTAAIHVESSYCSCKLTRVRAAAAEPPLGGRPPVSYGLQLQSLWIIPTAAAS